MIFRRYTSHSGFGANNVVDVDLVFHPDFSKVDRIVDDSHFVPSVELAKRIGRSAASYKGLYDSDAALQHGLDASYARRPGRDIVELQRFNESLYQRIEESLKSDLSEAQRKTLLAEQKRIKETQSVLDIINARKEEIPKED